VGDLQLKIHKSAPRCRERKNEGLKRSRESKSAWKKEGNGLKDQNEVISKEVKRRNTG
jgi:hypothetical protein